MDTELHNVRQHYQHIQLVLSFLWGWTLYSYSFWDYHGSNRLDGNLTGHDTVYVVLANTDSMEAAYSFETFVSIYKTARCNSAEDHKVNSVTVLLVTVQPMPNISSPNILYLKLRSILHYCEFLSTSFLHCLMDRDSSLRALDSSVEIVTSYGLYGWGLVPSTGNRCVGTSHISNNLRGGWCEIFLVTLTWGHQKKKESLPQMFLYSTTSRRALGST
jgi:hypothetical protein